MMYQEQNRLSDATPLFQRAAAIYERKSPDNSQIALVLMTQGISGGEFKSTNRRRIAA